MKITQVSDLGDDVLEVRAVTDAGEELVATGWVSAMMNYFPPEHYTTHPDLIDEETPHPMAGALTRIVDINPREMTSDEKMSYWLSLVGEDDVNNHSTNPIVLFKE